MKQAPNPAFVDIHTHILPGVDDGAEAMPAALELIRMAWEDGTRGIFLTPHYRGRYRKNTPDWLRETFQMLCEMVGERYPDMRLYLGSEISYQTDAPEKLAHGQILSMNDSQYGLLEFKTTSFRSQITTGISAMLDYGITPIIAHAERYEIFRKSPDLADEVLDMGALIQLNADSIMGTQGFEVKRYCHQLLRSGKVHFVASDAHDVRTRPPQLWACWQRISKKYGVEYANALFSGNAQAVINNEYL